MGSPIKRIKLDEEKNFNFENPDDPGLDPIIQTSHCDLCKAALEGNLPEIKSLFFEVKDAEMAATQTALHCATFKGHLEVVKYLVEESDENYIEKTNESNFTALTIAIWYDYRKIVEFLVENGANIHRQVKLYNSWHHTVLNTAAWRGRTSIVEFLLQKGVNVENPPTVKGYTPLMTACHRKHLETMALLLKYGANVNAVTAGSDKKQIWTALDAAIREGCLYIVQLLVENGLDLNKFLKDAIIYATELRRVKIQNYLKKKMEFYKWEKSSREETLTEKVGTGVVTKPKVSEDSQDDSHTGSLKKYFVHD